MFFQNSLVDRSVGEDPGNKREGVKNKYSIPKELGRTGNKKGIQQRAWSRVTRGGWGQNFILTFQETKFYTKEIIWETEEKLGPVVTLWETESVKINNYEIFIIFLRTETKEWYFIVKGSWFLQNFLFKTTFYGSRQGWHIWLVRDRRCARSRRRSLFQLLSRSRQLWLSLNTLKTERWWRGGGGGGKERIVDLTFISYYFHELSTQNAVALPLPFLLAKRNSRVLLWAGPHTR